jgi:hypothetical protein
VVYTEERRVSEPPNFSIMEDEEMLERILPLVGVSGILIFAFIIIMIVVSLARRPPHDYKDKSLHTHISFNRCLDQDFGPDLLQPLKPGSQRLAQLFSKLKKNSAIII